MFLPEEKRQSIFNYCNSIEVPNELSKPHGLIKDTIQYYKSRKESTKPPVNRVVNFKSSNEQKERIFRFLDTLFKALEHLGYTVENQFPLAKHYSNYEPRLFDSVIYIVFENDSVPIIIRELQKKVPHQLTEKERRDKERYSYTSIPDFDTVYP